MVIFCVITLLLALLGALLIERKRRSAAVDESRHRLAQIAFMNRKITATVYSEAIAHELIQPLAAILSNAEAAQLFLNQSPPQLEMVQEILANIKRDNLRAGDLIKSMRGLLTKSESKAEAKETRVNINEMVQKVLNFLAGEAKMRHVHLIEELTPVILFVTADPVQLQQVMVNLILNALDAIDEHDGARRCISVITALNDANNVQVSVLDSGAGFNENIERVFDSFFTTKAKGMGLGLAITEAIVQAHGGRIWAENAADGGVVRFTLPLSETITDE
ncbi:HAMP domain-containing histidine kinase [Undibacterium piscinae]|uniref:histidine kinase n=1 Tax=Undibacterium piscinae TaxID=2495591 RepID=A0A6M4A2H0_9BURK|nr:HAMP domain-containing histidine kinase [Undibacterium piscinae]